MRLGFIYMQLSTRLCIISQRAIGPFRTCTKRLTSRSGVSMAEGGRHKDTLSWNYDDQSSWGDINGCEVATQGKRQSPIDIQTSQVKINKTLTPLSLEGWDVLQKGMFVNTGHSLQFTLPDTHNPTMSTPQGTFALKQFHFHWGPTSNEGAEHKIDGFSYATEIHFVHKKTILSGPKDAADSLAVLGVLCSADNECSSTPWEQFKIPEDHGESISVNGIDISKYLPQNLDYYYYKGSLTTPPCSEKVLWYLIKQPLKVPDVFLERLRKIKDATGKQLTHNYRHCMPLHDRLVETPENI